MATKYGLRYYDERKSGKHNYRGYLDYWHPYEEIWKQVSVGFDSLTRTSVDLVKNKLEVKRDKILAGLNKRKVNLTVAEALDEWHKDRKGTVSEGTYYYDCCNMKAFRQEFGKWQVSKIEKEHVKSFLENLSVAPSSIKNYRSRLKLFFEFCEDEGYLDESPMLHLRQARHSETLEEVQKRKDKAFTVDEMGQLFDAMEARANQGKTSEIRQNNWRKRYLIEFQYSLGSRISESLGLRFQDVDFERRILYIRAQLDKRQSLAGNIVLKKLKTKQSEREVSLKDRELEIIRWFLEHNQTHSDFIFIQENGHCFSGPQLNRYLHSFCDVLPHRLESSFVTHMLRHSNAMLQKELGVDEQVIVRRGGWADTQMLSRVYTRHDSSVLEERANQILQGFSVKNSRKIHEESEDLRGISRGIPKTKVPKVV